MQDEHRHERKVSPLIVLAFVLSSMIILGFIASLFSFVVPEEGIVLHSDSTKTYSIQFPTFAELFLLDTTGTEKTTSTMTAIDQPIIVDTSLKQVEIQVDPNASQDPLLLQYPNGDKSVLDPFFEILERVNKEAKAIRVMHYGDSQIEQDRMTSYFRNQFQTKFGGYGPGLVPAYQTIPSFSIKQTNSPNWQRFTMFGKRNKMVSHKRYGALANFTRFAPLHNDSTFSDTVLYDAWTRLSATGKGYGTSRKYDRIRIFYGHNTKPVQITFLADGNMLGIDSLPAGPGLRIYEKEFESSPGELTLVFSGYDSPDFYHFSLESKKGVQVDNIAMRGSSGTVFSKIDRPLLKETYKALNVKLLILQFGGNTVPYIKDKKSADNYGQSFKHQIRTLQNMNPGASVIVIGPADMSIKKKDKYVTHPQVENVRNALKKATFECGGAYFDMYEVMGGENSMPTWVNAEPSLAAPDYIHFSPRGAKKVAKRFFQSLMADYEAYKRRKRS